MITGREEKELSKDWKREKNVGRRRVVLKKNNLSRKLRRIKESVF